MPPHKQIEQRLQQAVSAALPDADLTNVLVRPCPDPKFGDYQSNALMGLAKSRKLNPRQLAADVLSKLDVSDLCEKVDIAGAGFLNFHLKTSALSQVLAEAAKGEHLFYSKATQPRTYVVDFSSPNVAKPMHVGHIRSTILGDTLARVLRLLGHRVVTDNHIGDWGTQFGMLLVGWKKHETRAGSEPGDVETLAQIYKGIESAIQKETIGELGKRYPKKLEELGKEGLPESEIVKKMLNDLGANKPNDLSPTDVESRDELVKLQAGDPGNFAIWQKMRALSQVQFDTLYQRLGIKFDETLGESFYNPRLQQIVDDLRSKGIARESEGAMAVFFDDIPQLKDSPALIQKSDGAFNYTTTDLATLQHRLETWKPDEVIYVTDGRQQLHFQQLFAIFRRWHPESKTKLDHVWFGSILGEDGKPFKTRSGETVKLADLLDEAEERAARVVAEKNPDLPHSKIPEIARVVGIGAVKYADLLPNRQGDYVFSWDKLLALNGNTAAYLLYAYARIRSIFRKAAEDGGQRTEDRGQKSEDREQRTEVMLVVPEEIRLAKQLLNFGVVLEAVAEDFRPNFLCNYLYELAGHFTAFYEKCPVLKSEGQTRASRLILCDLTGRVLKQGLDVLGIETLEQM
ncbi:MAG: arginine--tRNA ligase [Verrucomicrobia bacterium]|nr:MAG: arginine--tRNA ligase [Verrucomicrobiota bacterium]